jgi:hypothetical protein
MLFSRLHDRPYPGAEAYTEQWRDLCARSNGREQVAGHSVEGRPLWRFEWGPNKAPSVLLTGLIHGVEVIGSLALHRLLEKVTSARRPITERLRLVVAPLLNPDSFAENMERLERGLPAWKRANARGVDLNRNFPPAGRVTGLLRVFAGSRYRWSPYYSGDEPFSEPETKAVRDLVQEIRPRLSIGFHSFGRLLLYPWAHSRRPSPREPSYRRLSEAFLRRIPSSTYRARQAIHLYPTEGDLDDWLEAEHQTLAFTVEVGMLDRRLLDPRRALNPFCWMNPTRIEAATEEVLPGLLGLLEAASEHVHEDSPARQST